MQQAFSDLVRLETVYESGADVKLELARLVGRRENPVNPSAPARACVMSAMFEISESSERGAMDMGYARNDGQRAVLSLEPFARPDPVKRSSEHVLKSGLAKVGLDCQ